MERYRDIVPRFDAFCEAINQPQPRDIRVNTLKSSVEDVVTALNREGVPFERMDWHDLFLRLPADARPGKTFAHWLGRYYVQEAVSGIPPVALDPEPGDSVLDLCAAPGSKTTQMAARMENRGEIYANDIRQNRMRALLANIYQQGVVSVQAVEQDGREVKENRQFDKVLVDVPCSAEGNARTETGLEKGAEMDEVTGLVPLQEQLLEKAVRVCKPGGTVVYSTCTFAPEENEQVVSTVLDRVAVEPFELDAPHSGGVTEWKGEKLDEALENCVRVYPHQLDSGGIFVAKLRKES